MQDNNQEFDLSLRSALENAGIQPPRDAWKKISRRLDAVAAPSSGSRGFAPAAWRWAGAALACAAVALGVFITVPGASERSVSIERGALTAEAVRIQEPGLQKAGVLGNPARSAKTAAVRMAAVPAAVEIDATAPQEKEETGNAAPAPAGGRKSVNPKRSGETYSYDGNSGVDPFALLAMEEDNGRKGFGATFLYAKGAIGGNDPDFTGRRAGMTMAPGVSSSGITELGESTYGIPLTLGLGVRFYLLPGFSIGTGVDYSLLTRTFTGKYTGPETSGLDEVSGDVQHTMQYIGVPVDLYYDILSSDKIKFYVYGGGEAEYCVSNKYTVFSSPRITCSEPVRKLQFSVGAGVGVEFRLSGKLGLYLDPGVRYYFPNSQPKSIRTDKPFMFNFDAGLRFSL